MDHMLTHSICGPSVRKAWQQRFYIILLLSVRLLYAKVSMLCEDKGTVALTAPYELGVRFRFILSFHHCRQFCIESGQGDPAVESIELRGDHHQTFLEFISPLSRPLHEYY